MTDLSVLALNCTLKSGDAESSTDLLLDQVLEAFGRHGVQGEKVRVVNEGVKFGVSKDEGDGDGWPAIRDKMLAADILVIGTPIWMGQPGSVAKMALERLDAELGETDDSGRMSTYNKVACAAIVGNEDGAHHSVAEILQALNDVGFSAAANACTYWVGEAMHGTDYKDLDQTPEVTADATKMMVSNAIHLARILKAENFPPIT